MELFKATKTKRYAFFITLDIIICALSVVISYFLRFNGDIPNDFYKGLILAAVFLTALKISFLWLFKIYKVPWRFFGLFEARKIFYSLFLSNLIFMLFYLTFDELFEPFPRSVIAIDFILSYLVISAFRALKRMILETKSSAPLNEPCIVIGATNKTIHVLKGMKQGYINYYAVSVVDGRDELVGTYCENFIVRPKHYIPQAIKKYDVKTAIIALRLSPQELKELYDELVNFGIKDVKIFSLIEDEKSKVQSKIRDISIEDLLARKPKDLDNGVVEKFIKNKVVLVTGAGGTIGSEICLQCLKFGAKELIMVDHSEFNLYKINELTLADERNRLKMVNIVYKDELAKIFAEFRPDIVVHAAAYKHVPLCEFNPRMAVRNNVLGTKNVMDLSDEYGVKRVVLISTDKAVRPTSIMGATKRICEIYSLNLNRFSKTEYVAVRFGNVLGSSGSVIPKFKTLIEANKPLTVTHPDIVRYFMLVSEACQLVLQAASIAKGGELFVLDMGKPIKIADLARKMLQLAGKEELGVKFVGLRPGEKLYEELLINESDKKTEFESIFVASGNEFSYDLELLKSQIQTLANCEDEKGIEAQICEIIPEFKHALNKDAS